MKVTSPAVVVNPAPHFKEYMLQINGVWHWIKHVSGQKYTRVAGILKVCGESHSFEIRPCTEEKLPELVEKFIMKHLSDGKKDAKFVVFTNKQATPPPGAKDGWVE